MQRTPKNRAAPANAEDNRRAFWSEAQRIAVKGAERPEPLTHEEIGRICRLALVGMTARSETPQG